MAYQTGAATSKEDFLAQLAAWLVARGWISDSTTTTEFHGHKSGVYVHLQVRASGMPWSVGGQYSTPSTPTLWGYLSTAYTAGSYTSSTTGAIKNTNNQIIGNGICIGSAPVSYHFFDDGGDNIVIVVERSPGLFHCCGFGLSITKHGGNWTGGAYIFGQVCAWYSGAGTASTTDSTRPPFHYSTYTSWNEASGFLRADVDSLTGKYLGCTGSTNPASGYTGKTLCSWAGGNENLPYQIPNCAPWLTVSAINGQIVLTPIRLFVPRDAGGYGLLGSFPSVYACGAVGSGYSNGNEITIGADTYKLFSGIAVKKVA